MTDEDWAELQRLALLAAADADQWVNVVLPGGIWRLIVERAGAATAGELTQLRAERDRLVELLRGIARDHADVHATLEILSDNAHYMWVDELL